MSFLNRSVSRKTAIVAVAATLALYLVLLWSFYTLAADRIAARFSLNDVPLAIQLPKFMPVTSTVHNRLKAELNDVLDVTVPVDQWVSARFPRQFSLDVALDTVVNLKTSVRYQAMVPVTAVFELTVPIQNPVLPVELPVKLPLTFDVPVDFTVPVDHPLPVKLNIPVIASVPEPVPVHLQAALQSSVPVKATLDATVLTKAEAHLMFPVAPVDLSLARADLGLSIGDISLVRRSLDYPVTAGGERKSSVASKALIYVYDAARQPPEWR